MYTRNFRGKHGKPGATQIYRDTCCLTTRQFVGFISDLFMAHVENPTQMPRTHSGEPQCKLAMFLDLLLTKPSVPRQCYLYAVILLRRFMSHNRKYPLTINNAYRIILTSIIVSARLLVDNPLNLDQWNEYSLGHYGTDLLAIFEQEYLQNIDWDVVVSLSEYSMFVQRLDVQAILRAYILDASHEVCHIALPIAKITKNYTGDPATLFNA